MGMSGLKAGVYRHYKGNLYEVIGLAKHSETGEKMVVYQALYNSPELKEEYGIRPMFVRPFSMFIEKVQVGGKVSPRFALVEDKRR